MHVLSHRDLRRAAVVVFAVPLAPLFVADYLFSVSRNLFWWTTSADIRKQERPSAMVRWTFYLVLYRWLPTPHIPLRGLQMDVGILYDGRLLTEACRWWNAFLAKRPYFTRIPGVIALDGDVCATIQASVSTANRALAVTLAQHVAPFGALAESSLALGYAFARIFDRGTGSDWLPDEQEITAQDFADNQERYSFIHGSNYLNGTKPGYWADLQSGYWNRFIIDAMRWSYNDQVSRWEQAIGATMGSGVGFAPLDEPAASLTNRFRDLLFEYGGRFFETETVEYALWHREYTPTDI